MNTVIIYDQVGQDSIKFFVVQGNHKNLDGVYINDMNCTDEQIDQLNDLIFDKETYSEKEALSDFPVQAVKDGAIVIVCGFLP